MRPELDARERQEIVDQTRHSAGLRLHDVEEALAGRGIITRRPLQGLDEAGQCRKRRAQFMAGIGDEIDAHLLDAAVRREIMKG
jgi:hypothetical protein